MEKSNLKEERRRLLTGPERAALALTALFLIAAAAVSLRPRAEIRLEQGSAAQISRLAPEADTAAGETLVDLNTADCDALQTLPGIGPELAGRILAYRAAHGPFTDAAELLQVDGIGEKTLARLLEHVTVGETEATP